MQTKEQKAEYMRQYRKKNLERVKEHQKKSYQKNKASFIARCKKWRAENPERKKEIDRKYMRKRRKSNHCIRVNESVTSQIYRAIRSQKRGRRWEDIVGYTLGDLMSHLEKQFDDTMSWDNYGSHWHIDHIKPKSLFSLDDLEECWSLDNLQPLEASANMRKGNKYRFA